MHEILSSAYERSEEAYLAVGNAPDDRREAWRAGEEGGLTLHSKSQLSNPTTSTDQPLSTLSKTKGTYSGTEVRIGIS
jgi:hypothetical protein